MYLVILSCIPQSPRYDSLRIVLADLLKHYLSNVVKEREDGDGGGQEEDRKSIVLPFHACSLLVYIVDQW